MSHVVAFTTLFISTLTLLVALYNANLSKKRFILDSYVSITIERLKELETSIIQYSILVKKYNHIRFTLWEQRNNKVKDFSERDLNNLVWEKDSVESKIKFLIEGKEEAKEIINEVAKINELIYFLPEQFIPGNEKKATRMLHKPCDQMLGVSREYINNEIIKVKNFKFKDI